jgi:hypothetical protein
MRRILRTLLCTFVFLTPASMDAYRTGKEGVQKPIISVYETFATTLPSTGPQPTQALPAALF